MDGELAKLLCCIQTASCTEDLALLRSRIITDDDPQYPTQALHVYSCNADVDINTKMLNLLVPKEQQVTIKAIDHAKDTRIDVTMPKSKANTGGLVEELHLAIMAIGAKVMLVVNIDVSDGLVNGAIGAVSGILTTDSQITTILVKFSSEQVGAAAIQKSPYKQEYPDAVPISRHEATFRIVRNKATRTQFPLVLSWSTTIHKVQGLTLNQIVVDMKGGRFGPG